MQTLILPISGLANKLIELRLPMGLVQLDPPTEHPQSAEHPTPCCTATTTARQVPVILPLYYAGAYPQHYYDHRVNPDVKATMKL